MGIYKKFVDDLEIQKNNLVTALNNKGIEATNTETLNTLVPKVANIEAGKPEQTKTVDLSMANSNQVISPDSGKVLNKVIVNKPSTLIPDNIKKDVNIGGVVGTLESGSFSGSGSEIKWYDPIN